MRGRGFSVWLVTAAVLLAATAAGVCLGTERFQPAQVAAALFRPEKDGAQDFVAAIVRGIRLPRVLLAGLCGALLAGSGAVFQGFFRNPLADSGIMGISSGATLGAVLSAMVPWGAANIPRLVQANVTALSAFAGAIGAALLICAASAFHGQRGDNTAIVLTGTAASAFFSALTSFLVLAKDRELQRMFMWTLGSLNGKGWDDLLLVLPAAAAAFLLLFFCSGFLDILGGGDQTAMALGLDTDRARRLVLAAGSLAAAAAVCMGGTIGFVGLVAPHVVRRICSPRHRLLVPLSMAWGACFLMAADTLARSVVPPTELPVGIVTALVGAPFFVSLLFSPGREGDARN